MKRAKGFSQKRKSINYCFSNLIVYKTRQKFSNSFLHVAECIFNLSCRICCSFCCTAESFVQFIKNYFLCTSSISRIQKRLNDLLLRLCKIKALFFKRVHSVNRVVQCLSNTLSCRRQIHLHNGCHIKNGFCGFFKIVAFYVTES